MHFGRIRSRSLGILACAATIGAQTTPEISQRDTPLNFSTSVNLVLVPVVVRDAQHHAIGTLKKEDFQLFDKNKLQTIAKFSVEKSEAPPILPDTSIETDKEGNPQPKPSATAAQPIAGHFILWLFDDVHLSFDDLAPTREAAKRVLKESFEPGTRAAIYTTSGHTSLDFTDDRNKLDATLDQIRPWPTIPSGTVPDCPDISYFQADLIINASDAQALTAVESEYLMCNPLPNGVPTPNEPGGAGVTPSVARSYIQSQIEGPVRATTQKAFNIGYQDTRNTLLALKGLVRRMSAMPGSRTIVVVSPGFYLVTDHRTDEMEIIDNAIRHNVVISALDARGLSSFASGAKARTGRPSCRRLSQHGSLEYQNAVRPSDRACQYGRSARIGRRHRRRLLP
jgi:VWFA-related protein